MVAAAVVFAALVFAWGLRPSPWASRRRVGRDVRAEQSVRAGRLRGGS